MRKLILVCCLFSFSIIAKAQSVKMVIAGVTVAAGEDVMAFEGADTLPRILFSGSGAGKVSFSLIKIKKLQDASTSLLFRYSCLGTHVADVTFLFYDSNNVLFYQVSLKSAVVTHFSYLSPECAGCSKLYHQVWFDYTKIETTDILANTSVKFDRAANATY